jgi:predicted TIM-barrel fold metal-dependent hydrolase
VIIDAHAHVVFPIEAQIAAMDEAGIDRTVLMQTQNHPERGTTLTTFKAEWQILQETLSGQRNAIDARRAAADEQWASVRSHPDRFLGWGNIPLGLSDEDTAHWAQTYVAERGYVGIGEITHAPGQATLIEPLFKAAADHGNLPVFVHGIAPTTWDDLAATQAIAERYPHVPLIIGAHGGFNWLQVIEMISGTHNTYLDVSGTFSVLQPTVAAAEIPDRLIFGSNSPYGDPWLTRQTIERVITSPELRAAVLGDTAASLLGL